MSGRFARQQAKQRAQKFRRLDADHFHAHLFSSSLSPQKQQPGCRQRHTQRNQKKLHRQAQKHDQHPRKHEEDADDAHFTTHSNRFVLGFLMLAFCVGLGSYVTTGLTKLCGFNFPAYIGPMLVAVAVRNLIDHTGHIEFPAAEISTIAAVHAKRSAVSK